MYVCVGGNVVEKMFWRKKRGGTHVSWGCEKHSSVLILMIHGVCWASHHLLLLVDVLLLVVVVLLVGGRGCVLLRAR